MFINFLKSKRNVFGGSALVFALVFTFLLLGVGTAFAAAPDLSISSGPSVSPHTPTEGGTVTFGATVQNQNVNTGEDFTLRFRVDGQIIRDFDIAVLGKSGSRTKETTWTATKGNHTVRVCADAPTPGVIAEEKESNNCSETTFSVTPKSQLFPDLTISSGPTVSPLKILAGDEVNFNVVVKNQGDVNTAGDFTVRFRVDGKIIKDTDSTTLGAGNTREKEASWTATEGTHTLRVCADAKTPGVINESNEGNNCSETDFTVSAASTGMCSNGVSLNIHEFKEAIDKGLVTYSLDIASGNTSTSFTINNQTGCTIPISFSAYKRVDELFLSTQQFHAGTGLVDVGKSASFNLDLPDCSVQIDAWYGLHPQTLLDSNPYDYPNNPWAFVFNHTHEELCKDIPPPPPPGPDKADVSIQKSVNPTSGGVGETFTYTLAYKNEGALAAENVAIADVASPVGRLGSYNITSGPAHGSCAPKSNGITCSLGMLVSGAGGTITYTATALNTGVVDNAAIINTSTSETDLTNNEDYAQVTIASTPGNPPASCDSFSASPTNISPGGSSTLTWATTNATSVSINGGSGGGPGSVSDDGFVNVSPSSDITYTLVAIGAGGNDTCTATVTITTPTSPSCSLSLSPSVIISGNSSILSWTTTNVASASIDQGIGSVALPTSSTSVSPISNTTYTMTAIGTNGTMITCSAPIVVTSAAPSCTLSANTSVVSPGGSTDLTWTTTNATSASIDQSIGSVTPVPGGTTSATGITSNTTYTLTATGPGGSIDCPALVTVSSTPIADLAITKDVAPSSVEKGGVFTYTLNYSNVGTLDALSATISDVASPTGLLNNYTITSGPAHGTCTANTNGISCSLGTLAAGESGTITYKATGIEVGIIDNTATISTPTTETTLANNSDSEQVSVFIPQEPPCTINCGGGMNPPRVVMFMKPGEDQPFASQSFVYLSQIPYTGVTGGAKQALFIILLSLWSAVVAYLIIRRWKGGELVMSASPVTPIADRSFIKIEEDRALSMEELIEEKKEDILLKAEPVELSRTDTSKPSPEGSKSIPFNGNNLPVAEKVPKPVKTKSVETEVDVNLEKYAKEKGVLLSEEALNLIRVPMATGHPERLEVLSSIINIALTMYPKDDGWVVLDRKRIENVIFSSRYDVVSIFSDWLSCGESQKVFAFLRLLRSHKVSVKEFLKKVAYFIDNLYRCRIGESLDNEHIIVDLENQCTNWSTRDIQKIVGILVNGVDESYSSEDASVKLAIVKILEISNKSQVEGKSYYGA